MLITFTTVLHSNRNDNTVHICRPCIELVVNWSNTSDVYRFMFSRVRYYWELT